MRTTRGCPAVLRCGHGRAGVAGLSMGLSRNWGHPVPLVPRMEPVPPSFALVGGLCHRARAT
jgi:hypothetical protein